MNEREAEEGSSAAPLRGTLAGLVPALSGTQTAQALEKKGEPLQWHLVLGRASTLHLFLDAYKASLPPISSIVRFANAKQSR